MKSTYRIYSDGTKKWTLPNGLYHREDGPAVECANGTKYWYINGYYHRECGPAIDRINGTKEWYINGYRIDCSTNEEFLKLIKLIPFW